MGILSKLKGVFYDEVVVDEDEKDNNKEELSKVNKIVRRETKEREIEEKPKIEEIKYKTIETEPEDLVVEKPKTDNTFSERDLFKSDRTFDFVEFDAEEEKEMVLPKRNVLSEQNRNTRVESPTIPDTPKIFKPTPIISPVWGVLDKDYKKEEIKEKEISNDSLSSSVTSYDTVRRKAYGTLEDELEDTLNSMNKLSTDTIKKEINKVDKDADLLEQKTSKIEDLINKIEEETKDIDKDLSIGELEDKAELENFEDEEEPEVEKTLTDSTLEHDLFNLIDSMYDKED